LSPTLAKHFGVYARPHACHWRLGEEWEMASALRAHDLWGRQRQTRWQPHGVFHKGTEPFVSTSLSPIAKRTSTGEGSIPFWWSLKNYNSPPSNYTLSTCYVKSLF
jgi:hypothetical protein